MKESLKVIKKVNESEHDKRKKQNINEIKEHVYGSQYKTAFEANVDVLETTYNKISLFVKKARSNIRKKLGIEKRLSISKFIINEYYLKRENTKKEGANRKGE